MFVSTSYINTINVTLRSITVRRYAFKSDLKIKWVRPEKIPCYKPEKTGDLGGIPNIDNKQPMLEFRNSKQLETANENVKKLFSLEFGTKRQQKEQYFDEFVDKVRRHEFDIGSAEVKIAKWTGIIRALQEVMEQCPRNKRLKVYLKELIDHRKKSLKYLRRWDYKRFEWLLEVLSIAYKPPPNEFHWVTRKDSLRELTNRYVDNIKQDRLNAYRLKLESEQIIFLEENIRALVLMNEAKKLGVNVNVTEADIEKVKDRLNELEQKKSSQLKVS